MSERCALWQSSDIMIKACIQEQITIDELMSQGSKGPASSSNHQGRGYATPRSARSNNSRRSNTGGSRRMQDSVASKASRHEIRGENTGTAIQQQQQTSPTQMRMLDAQNLYSTPPMLYGAKEGQGFSTSPPHKSKLPKHTNKNHNSVSRR